MHVVLVDGNGFIFRAYHRFPSMTRPDGTPVNAVYGVTTMLMRLMEKTDADHMAVIFDSARHTFRNDIYPAYKAHRPPPPDDLVPQFALIREAVDALNLPRVEVIGFEADDIIATYAKQASAAGAEVTIVSSDKDLMQLVNEQVTMLDPMTWQKIDVAAVKEQFGVFPDRVADVQALAGDAVDNVPGIHGIGIKTAARLINQFGDLKTLLRFACEVGGKKGRSLIDHADIARISKQLVTLRDDVPVPTPLDGLARRDIDPSALRAFLDRQSFVTLMMQ